MKWQGRRRSSNVEDRRGGGGGKSIAGIGGGFGIILLIVVTLMGGNPTDFLGSMDNQETTPYVETQEEKQLSEFVSVVLADTEDVWTDIFRENNIEYEKPTLVLFTNSVESACGTAGSSTGPFYCPADRKLYIDLSFYKQLSERFNAPGDFAMAYVVAHEVGHHVQTLLGVSQQVNDLRRELSEKEYNQYSIRLELQADYLAGVWAKRTQEKDLLNEGDIEEALRAAGAVGDDTLQKQAQGYVVPDSFTHGTSEQRQRWFYKGFNAGNLDDWDTFNTRDL